MIYTSRQALSGWIAGKISARCFTGSHECFQQPEAVRLLWNRFSINWAVKAPAIAGLIGYTHDQGVRLLTSGVTRDGRVPNPPMPPFRMSVRDAEAVVA